MASYRQPRHHIQTVRANDEIHRHSEIENFCDTYFANSVMFIKYCRSSPRANNL